LRITNAQDMAARLGRRKKGQEQPTSQAREPVRYEDVHPPVLSGRPGFDPVIKKVFLFRGVCACCLWRKREGGCSFHPDYKAPSQAQPRRRAVSPVAARHLTPTAAALDIVADLERLETMDEEALRASGRVVAADGDLVAGEAVARFPGAGRSGGGEGGDAGYPTG
jgi:hypothetical protein